jgi:hypothetical protein
VVHTLKAKRYVLIDEMRLVRFMELADITSTNLDDQCHAVAPYALLHPSEGVQSYAHVISLILTGK